MGVEINGRDLSSLGIGQTQITGWADGPRESRDAFQTAGQFGQIEGSVETVATRTLSIEGNVRGNTVATRDAVIEEALAHMRGRCEIRSTDDQPEKLFLGFLERTRVEPISDLRVFDLDAVRIRLDFTCYDPLGRDRHAQVAAFDATARDVPMGTGPHRGIIRLAGVATNPEIIVRDFRGVQVASLDFNGSSLAADEAWIVDLYQHTITLSDSGVESSVPSVLDSGSFFAFDPAWANWESASWPTIEVDSGEGDLTYYRRWKT